MDGARTRYILSIEMIEGRWPGVFAYGKDNVRAVSLFCNDLQPVNGLGVSDDIVQQDRSVLFYPACRACVRVRIDTQLQLASNAR